MEPIETIVEGDYTTDIYANGARVTYPTENPPKTVQLPILTEIERAILEMASNIELMTALAEFKSGM